VVSRAGDGKEVVKKEDAMCLRSCLDLLRHNYRHSWRVAFGLTKTTTTDTERDCGEIILERGCKVFRVWTCQDNDYRHGWIEVTFGLTKTTTTKTEHDCGEIILERGCNVFEVTFGLAKTTITDTAGEVAFGLTKTTTTETEPNCGKIILA